MADEPKSRRSSQPMFTPRQLRFIEEYVVDFNGAQAAIRAGYSKRTAKEQATRLLTKAHVKAEIEKRKKAIAAKCEVTTERIIKEYAAMAFVDPAEFYHPNGKIRTLRQMPEEARRALTGISKTEKGYKLVMDKKGALDSLSRILGMFHDKIEHLGADHLAEDIEAARRRAHKRSRRMRRLEKEEH